MCRGPDQVTERTESMLANHFTVVHRFEVETVALLHIDVEMIAPKLDHELVKLSLAVDLSDQCGLAQLIGNGLTVVIIEESVADRLQFVGIHVQRLERLQQKVAVKIVDGLHIKLFLDPGLRSDFYEASAFLDAWTKGKAVQGHEAARVERSPGDGGEIACQPT